MNICILKGNLTEDPELKQTQSGDLVTTVTVAVNRRFQKDKTDFITVEAWKNTAEIICKYFQKGQQIIVTGELISSSYTAPDGSTRYTWRVRADNVEFCGKREARPQPQQQMAAPFQPQAPHFEEISPDEDLPF